MKAVTAVIIVFFISTLPNSQPGIDCVQFRSALHTVSLSPMKFSPGRLSGAAKNVGGDAAPAIVYCLWNFFDLLLHRFHVEARALFPLAEFDEVLTPPSAHINR
jgi:hypothetical protein